MHTVELLEYALETARAIGFQIREVWLGGTGGGACVLKGQKWIFLDVSDRRRRTTGPGGHRTGTRSRDRGHGTSRRAASTCAGEEVRVSGRE